MGKPTVAEAKKAAKEAVNRARVKEARCEVALSKAQYELLIAQLFYQTLSRLSER